MRSCAFKNPLNVWKFLWKGTVSLHVFALKCLANLWSLLVEGLIHPWGRLEGRCGSGLGTGSHSR